MFNFFNGVRCSFSSIVVHLRLLRIGSISSSCISVLLSWLLIVSSSFGMIWSSLFLGSRFNSSCSISMVSKCMVGYSWFSSCLCSSTSGFVGFSSLTSLQIVDFTSFIILSISFAGTLFSCWMNLLCVAMVLAVSRRLE
uniref:Uncharacterized protein n=1 Tax=Cacopsylla melanoneura TaxID=428564 RepID=A0A8D8Y4W6_9HEMI